MTMASSKEFPSSRPMSGSLPRHHASSRQHSHSVSLGATNSSHRIQRRKSMNQSTASNAAAAVAAALREQGEPAAIPTHTHRRSLGSRKGFESTSMGAPSNMTALFSRPTSSHHGGVGGLKSSNDGYDDIAIDETVPAEKLGGSKNRNRRASEGSHLIKGEGKRIGAELRCDTCGKGYKHSSCLTKHMWEHDPAWAVTSKFLISKHQQVQLLEAASVLVTMNADGSSPPPEGGQAHDSEGSSASPEYSGSSEMLSSAETSPSPMGDGAYPVPDQKRQSIGSTNFSRSYRSIPSSSYTESVISPGLPPHHFPADLRPSTAGTDDTGLAAAAELLNFGTPRSRPTQVLDVPPVPPLPERYQAASKLGNSATPTMYNTLNMHPPSLTHALSDERAARPHGPVEIGPYDRKLPTPEEDDVGMFRMEE